MAASSGYREDGAIGRGKDINDGIRRRLMTTTTMGRLEVDNQARKPVFGSAAATAIPQTLRTDHQPARLCAV